jgi:hypothetical protein
MQDKYHLKLQTQNKITEYLEDCCLDVQGFSPSSMSSIAETQLARILTKIAIGSATVWWSLLELKDFVNIRKTLKD